MNRRRFLGAIATGSTVSAAGCLGGLLDEMTTFAASPATVSADALEEAGYDDGGTEELVEEREFAGETVEVTNYASEYYRTIELPGLDPLEAGVFATIASPEVGVAGQDFNPLEEMENDEIAEMIQGQYAALSIGDRVDDREVETLGTTVSVTTYEGQAELVDTETASLGIRPLVDDTLPEEIDPTAMDVLIDIATAKHGDDHLVLVGIYPDYVPEEDDRVTTLIEGLEHDG
ncbi:DUF6517 family protein [Natrialbaceae archaeon AArc-T1-2]|uniref:DUF6517 family protein n=1 Tax=Natrialbaceae archaeon AArc-T1-2 TaxID=3053904 RepID=UPI00255AEC24|nr:DUF6517 family protein [Natrialbaceae archaeon AArc-T1-2]WIV66098.1 DUF6517 family protein [Natrialbaceae archaeon AArc-T1-2]